MSGAAAGAAPSGVDRGQMFEIMKLQAQTDPIIFDAIKAWVDTEPRKSTCIPSTLKPTMGPVCRTVSTLLIVRLLHAYEKRSDQSEAKTEKSDPPTNSQPNSTHGTTLGSVGVVNQGMGSNTSETAPAAKKPMKKVPPLKDMMSRPVKITRMVMEAIQFVGSDILKLLVVTPNAPTVADIATCAIRLLNDGNRCNDCYRIFVASRKNIDPMSLDLDLKEATFFGVFALQSLLAMREQATSTYELAYDYDFIYEMTFTSNPTFKASVEALGTAPQLPAGSLTAYTRDTEARNVSWKLTRFLSLKQDFTDRTVDQQNSPRTYMQRRRDHLVNCAAAIVFSAELGRMNQNLSDPLLMKNVRLCADIIPATSTLISFLNAGTDKILQPIRQKDVTAVLNELRKMIMELPSVNLRWGNSQWPTIGSSAALFLLPTEIQKYLSQNYTHIIKDLVMGLHEPLNFGQTTQTDRQKRTPLSRTLFLFPMVVGEPWGFHRNAPIITSRQLCLSTSNRSSTSGLVALVLKANHRPTPPKRKPSTSPGSSPEPSSKRPALNTVRSNNQPPAKLPAKPRPPKVVKMSDVDPPIVNEAMELNEWTLSVLSLSIIKPSDTLLTFLGEHDRRRGDSLLCLQEVIVPVLNRGITRIQKSLQASHSTNTASRKSSAQILVGKRDGRVYVNGAVNEDLQLCASVVGFFYHSLEAIMDDQLRRLEFLGPFNAMMQSESFHRALLALCYACILKGVGATHRLQIDGSCKDRTVFYLLQTIECNPYTFLKVTEALRRALVVSAGETNRMSSSPLIPSFPAKMHQYVQKIEVQLLESVIWAQSMPSTKSEPTMAVTISSMKSLPGSWPPDVLSPDMPEELIDASQGPARSNEIRFKPTFSASSESNFFSYVLRKVLKVAFFRIGRIFATLDVPGGTTVVQTQVYVAFRYFLRHHIDVLFERHMDQIILCTIYGVCRVMNVRSAVGSNNVVTFGQIIDAYTSVRRDDQGDRSSRLITRHVKLMTSEYEVPARGQFFGPITEFFNQVYLVKMQRHFFGSKSLQKSVVEYDQLLQSMKEQSRSGGSMVGSKSGPSTLTPPPPATTTTTTTTQPTAATAAVAASTQPTTGDMTGASLPPSTSIRLVAGRWTSSSPASTPTRTSLTTNTMATTSPNVRTAVATRPLLSSPPSLSASASSGIIPMTIGEAIPSRSTEPTSVGIQNRSFTSSGLVGDRINRLGDRMGN